MAYLNRVQLIGYVGEIPKISVSPTGIKTAKLLLVTNRIYKEDNGEIKKQTCWHKIIACGKLANLIERLNVNKSSLVYVDGPITTKSFFDNEANKYTTTTEIQVNIFQLLSEQDKYKNNNSYNNENFSICDNYRE